MFLSVAAFLTSCSMHCHSTMILSGRYPAPLSTSWNRWIRMVMPSFPKVDHSSVVLSHFLISRHDDADSSLLTMSSSLLSNCSNSSPTVVWRSARTHLSHVRPAGWFSFTPLNSLSSSRNFFDICLTSGLSHSNSSMVFVRFKAAMASYTMMSFLWKLKESNDRHFTMSCSSRLFFMNRDCFMVRNIADALFCCSFLPLSLSIICSKCWTNGA